MCSNLYGGVPPSDCGVHEPGTDTLRVLLEEHEEILAGSLLCFKVNDYLGSVIFEQARHYLYLYAVNDYEGTTEVIGEHTDVCLSIQLPEISEVIDGAIELCLFSSTIVWLHI